MPGDVREANTTRARPYDVEGVERGDAARGEQRRKPRSADTECRDHRLVRGLHGQVGDREAELKDDTHRIGDHADEAVREDDAARDSDGDAEDAERDRLRHHQPEELARFGADELKLRHRERALHGPGRSRVVDDVRADDERYQAEGRQHGLE